MLDPDRARDRRTGFTLVELLVVMVVIVVLVAILLPALANAREHARVAVCVSNVRNQSVAVAQYANDQHEAMPPRSARMHISDGGSGFTDGIFSINRFLSEYEGVEFAPDPDQPLGRPIGAWRCPDVPPERDSERFTHEGVLHHAPNGWLFNAWIVDEEQGTMNVWCDMLDPWEPRWSHHSWRVLSDVWRPHAVIELMDNVNYFFFPHGHRDARDRYSYSTHAVHNRGDPTLPDNVGSHDNLEVRPAVYLDGHGEAVSSSTAYWLGAQHEYRPAGGGAGQTFYDREVEKFMWFIEPGSTLPAQ